MIASLGAMPRWFWFATILCVLAAGTFISDRTLNGNRALLTDFRAFYCAGSVRLAGNDPYHVEPLRTCEHRVAGPGGPPGPGVVEPAPVPGYDLAVFSLLAKLPYPVAALLWETLALASIGITVAALTKLTQREPDVVVAALILESVASLFLGQLVPVAVAALALAMLYLSRERYRTASVFVTLALIEPHVGVAAWLAVFLFAPRSRPPLLLLGAGLALLSVAWNGPAGELEYVRSVVPAHVLAEINSDDQYSLAHLAKMLAAGDDVARSLGTWSYLALLAAGLGCARALARRTGERAFLIAVPMVFVLMGGPYLHVHHVAAALPCALLLFSRFPRERILCGFAILLLAIPWGYWFLLLHFAALLFAVVMLLTARLLRLNALAQVGAAAVAVAIAVISSAVFIAPSQAIPPLAGVRSDALAESIWRIYIDARHTGNGTLFLLLKIPTWVALVTLTGLVAQQLLRPRGGGNAVADARDA